MLVIISTVPTVLFKLIHNCVYVHKVHVHAIDALYTYIAALQLVTAIYHACACG